MRAFLILLDDVTVIQHDRGQLIDAIKTFSGTDPLIYRSPYFVEGTGYARTVYDEVEFVTSSQTKLGLAQTETRQLLDRWQLEKYRDYELSQLSGGWRKFLGLALFSNQKSACKIFFDSFRQLSDRLIENLIHNLDGSGTDYVFFVEFDAEYMKGQGMERLLFTEGRLEPESQSKPDKINATESNYV